MEGGISCSEAQDVCRESYNGLVAGVSSRWENDNYGQLGGGYGHML